MLPFYCGNSLSYLTNCNQQPSFSYNSEPDINEHLLHIITSKNSWFNGSKIDSYMKVLSHTHYLLVYAVCCSWVGERFFTLKSNSPKLFVSNEENKNFMWFDNDYVLFPVKANGILYMCNSKNHIYSGHTS